MPRLDLWVLCLGAVLVSVMEVVGCQFSIQAGCHANGLRKNLSAGTRSGHVDQVIDTGILGCKFTN